MRFKNFFNLKYFSLGLIFVALGISFAILGYNYHKSQLTIATLKQSSQKISSESDTKSILDKVSAFYVFPDDSNPSIATVTNIEKLKNQDFFKNAKNGDRVLIFTKSQKAVLYRPEINKIIEIAPVSLSSPSASSKP